MRHFIHGFALSLTVAATALLARPAHAQTATLQGDWTDPSGAYLIRVGEGYPINPPAGGGGGAWFEYQANVTYRDGSALLTSDDQGNPVPVSFTITAQLHGNGSWYNPFQVEYRYVIQAAGYDPDTGIGHLSLSRDQSTLDGSWKDDLDGSTGRLTLVRVPSQ
jgi:hypothetical protein